MATLKDIAARTGVSATTVSLVLNGRALPGQVSRAKQQEILAAAQELEYVPNLRARAMVTRRSRTIGVICTTPSSSDDADAQGYVFGVLTGVEQQCRAAGFHCLFSVHDEHTIDEFIRPRAMQDGSIDGAVLVQYTNWRFVERIGQAGLPCVHIGTNIDPGTQVRCVSGDLDAAFEVAARRLRALGHTRVRLILPAGPGPMALAENFRALTTRIDGLRAEAVVLESSGDDGVASAFSRERLVAEGGALPTAFILGHVTLLSPLVSSMVEIRRVCPLDYSVVSVVSSSATMAVYDEVMLSTIRIPVYDVGRRAASILLSQLGEGDATQALSSVIPCEVVFREACGVRAAGLADAT